MNDYSTEVSGTPTAEVESDIAMETDRTDLTDSVADSTKMVSEETLSQMCIQFQNTDINTAQLESIAEMQYQHTQLRSQQKLLLYKGSVFGAQTEILIDPGATSSFCDSQFAQILGVKQEPVSFSVGLVGGHQLQCKSRLKDASIKIGTFKDVITLTSWT